MSITETPITPVPLTYRISTEVNPTDTTGTSNGPLSIMQIDSNTKSIEQGFERAQRNVDALDAAIDLKADKNRPEFTGYVRIPVASQESLNSLPKKDGLMMGVKYTDRVTKTQYTSLSLYADNKWQQLATVEGTTGYVSKYGDTLYGKLIGTTAEFDSGDYIFGLKTISPDVDSAVQEGESADDKRVELRNLLDKVATANWVKNTIDTKITDRLGGGVAGDITANDFNAKKIVITGADNEDSIDIKQGNLKLSNGDLTIFDGDITLYETLPNNKGAIIGRTVTAGNFVGHIDFGVMDDDMF